MDCYSCAREAESAELPPRERVATDDLWRAAHAIDVDVPGWLVLVPRRHVTSIAALTDAEAAALGSWQVRLSRAVQRVVGCEKTYVAQFAESTGFTHVHFHIIPRANGLPADRRGPRIFGPAGADAQQVSPTEMDEIAQLVARELAD